MELYLLSQTENVGYDTYDSCVVAASDPEEAVRTGPDEYAKWDEEEQKFYDDYGNGKKQYHNGRFSTWASHIKNIQVRHLGKAVEGTEEGYILASFNAG
jgi:hypothetical protein